MSSVAGIMAAAGIMARMDARFWAFFVFLFGLAEVGN
jgi:hypothetical protein